MSEYPKWMRHPNYRPAVVEEPVDVGQIGAALKRGDQFMPRSLPMSKPEWMPPVTALDKREEDYYMARGYVPAKPKPPVPVVEEEEVELDPTLWPRWVEGVLCRTPAEEARVLTQVPEPSGFDEMSAEQLTYVHPDELAEFREWQRARGASKNEPVKRKRATKAEMAARRQNGANGHAETDTEREDDGGGEGREQIEEGVSG